MLTNILSRETCIGHPTNETLERCWPFGITPYDHQQQQFASSALSSSSSSGPAVNIPLPVGRRNFFVTPQYSNVERTSLFSSSTSSNAQDVPSSFLSAASRPSQQQQQQLAIQTSYPLRIQLRVLTGSLRVLLSTDSSTFYTLPHDIVDVRNNRHDPQFLFISGHETDPSKIPVLLPEYVHFTVVFSTRYMLGQCLHIYSYLVVVLT